MNLYKYSKERNIFEKYKNSILKMIALRISYCKNLPNQYQNTIKIANKILKDINFPNEFEEFDIEPKEKSVFVEPIL